MKIIRIVVPVFLALIFAACSVHTDLEPLAPGKITANASLGGPIVKSGTMHVLLPYSTIGGVVGLGSNINVSANLHVTPLFYELGGLDIGASYFLTNNSGYVPTVGLHPSLLTFFSFKSTVTDHARSYPSVSLTSAWHVGKDIVFTGFDYTVPMTRPDYDTDAPHAIFSPFIGYGLQLSPSLRLIAEMKWQAANVESDQMAVEYSRISGHGAVGVLFGLEKSF